MASGNVPKSWRYFNTNVAPTTARQRTHDLLVSAPLARPVSENNKRSSCDFRTLPDALVGIARGCRVVCTFGLRTLATIIAVEAARATRPTRTNANHAITSAMLKKVPFGSLNYAHCQNIIALIVSRKYHHHLLCRSRLQAE